MIDDWLDGEWPESARTAAAQFKQGDLIEAPPFFYVATAAHGIWRPTKDLGDAELQDELFELAEEDAPPFGMITTETCDLTEEEREPRQPWLSIAPVYKIEQPTAALIKLLEADRLAYMHLIRSERFSDATWVADLRVEFPIEKSWLVTKSPITVFDSEEARINLARFLAGRRDRPVLSHKIHRCLIVPLRRWIEKMNPEKREKTLQGIKQVRVAVAGSADDPDGASLIIVSDSEPISDEVQELWDEKWVNWRDRMLNMEMSLLSNEYTTLDELSARRYRDSFEIPLDFYS